MILRRIAALAATTTLALTVLPTAIATAADGNRTPVTSGTAIVVDEDLPTPHVRTDMRSLYRRAGFTATTAAKTTTDTPLSDTSVVASGPTDTTSTPQPVIVQRNAAGQLLPPGLRDHVDTYCDGIGNDANRVQIMYLREAGWPDRYTASLPLIRNEARYIDDSFAVAAQKDGSGLRVRWVTNNEAQGCTPTVLNVVLPSGAMAGTFNNIETALFDAGYLKAGRKYLAFSETTFENSNTACASGRVFQDSNPTDNKNDGRNPQLAILGANCWVTTENYSSQPLHELLHTLGAVQTDAPHGTGGFHCTDNGDVMCYDDGYGVPTVVCPETNEYDIDCNDDDYFNTNPTPGSYLATHWNVAKSPFLTTVPTLPNPPAVSVTADNQTPVGGQKVTFTAAVDPGTTVTWSTDIPDCEDPRVPNTGTTFTIQCFSRATPTVIATASNSTGLTVSYAWKTITYGPGPIMDLTINAPLTVTTGVPFTATASVSNTAPEDYTYQWAITPAGCTSSNGTTSTTVNLTCGSTTAGKTLSMTVTAVRVVDGRDLVATRGATITAPEAPNPTGTLNGPDAAIAGTTATFTVDGADPNTIFQWADGNGWPGTATGPTFKVPIPKKADKTSDTVYVSLTLGKKTVVLTKGYTIEKPLAVTVSGPTTLAPGSSGVYAVTTNKPANLNWTLDGSCTLGDGPDALSRTVTCPEGYLGSDVLTVTGSDDLEEVTRELTITVTDVPETMDTRLTFKASKGYPSHMSARLTTTDGGGLSGKDLLLQHKNTSNKWVTDKTIPTGSTGAASWDMVVTKATTYRVVFKGSGQYGPVTSQTHTVKVKVLLVNTKMKGGLRATLQTAWHKAISGQKIGLQQRKVGSRKWKSVDAFRTNKNGQVTFKVNPKNRTDYRWKFAGTADYYPVVSGHVRLT